MGEGWERGECGVGEGRETNRGGAEVGYCRRDEICFVQSRVSGGAEEGWEERPDMFQQHSLVFVSPGNKSLVVL